MKSKLVWMIMYLMYKNHLAIFYAVSLSFTEVFNMSDMYLKLSSNRPTS